MINFNVPPYTGKEIEYIKQAVENQKSVEMVLLRRNVMNGSRKKQERRNVF